MEKISAKEFASKVINGIALGVVVGLQPNAMLGEILKPFASSNEFAQLLLNVVVGLQSTVPALVGLLVAMQFALNPLCTVIVAATSFIGSGVVVFTEQGFMIRGTGDLINTMLVAALSVFVLRSIGNKLGSLSVVLLPLISCAFIGAFGLMMLPYVKQVTSFVGQIVLFCTEQQPLIMSILISMLFAIIIVSPISTVAICLAINISGLASGAASVGIGSTCAVLVVGTYMSNKIGTPISVFFGALKMMMPNWIKNPIMNLPLLINAAISGVFAYLFNIQTTAQSAGFGSTALVGPIQAYAHMEGVATMTRYINIALAYYIVPYAVAVIVMIVCTKVLKLYNNDIFKVNF